MLEKSYSIQSKSTDYKWSQLPESNRRPTHYECVALPAELSWLEWFVKINIRNKKENGKRY